MASSLLAELSAAEIAPPGGPCLLSNVNLRLAAGWSAVTGANGTGKSTLLLTLARRVPLRAGTLSAPAGVALVPQTSEVPDPLTRAFFEDYSRAALAWRSRFELEDDVPYRWESASPGERKRWQLAAAMLSQPDLLLVDEPSNHLDAGARERLVAGLRRFEGVGVLVSHDRALLDALCTRTVDLRAHRAQSLEMPPSAARSFWAEAEAADLREAAELGKAARRARAERIESRLEAERAQSNIGARSRMKSVRDHDARGAGAKARVENAAAKLARRAAAARTREARALRALPVPDRDRRRATPVAFRSRATRHPKIAALDLQALEVPNKVLTGRLQLVIRPQDRLAIEGPNGAGKSTLLRALFRTCPLPPEACLWLPQETTEQDAERWASRLRERAPSEKGALLARAAALGLEVKRLLDGGRLSPGEVRKAILADALGRDVAALFLDEPTNHLDLPSVERLEAALADYPGTIVMVSHDTRFSEAIGAVRWPFPRR